MEFFIKFNQFLKICENIFYFKIYIYQKFEFILFTRKYSNRNYKKLKLKKLKN